MEGVTAAARVADIGAGAEIAAVIGAAIAAAQVEIGAVIESAKGAATEAAPDVEQVPTKEETRQDYRKRSYDDSHERQTSWRRAHQRRRVSRPDEPRRWSRGRSISPVAVDAGASGRTLRPGTAQENGLADIASSRRARPKTLGATARYRATVQVFLLAHPSACDSTGSAR